MIQKTSIFLMILTLLSACSKDKDESPAPAPPSPAIGFWSGSYTTTGQLGASKYAMLLQPGGVGRVYDLGAQNDTNAIPAGSRANLVWSLTGNTVQTTYATGAQTVNTTATLNAANNSMSGNWAFGAIVKGNITLNKQ